MTQLQKYTHFYNDLCVSQNPRKNAVKKHAPFAVKIDGFANLTLET